MIRQGEVYWIDLGDPNGSAPAFRHPHVVVQNDLFNRSRIGTVVVCSLTSNLRRALAPGNVMLEQGEASLPKQSVVNVSQIYTVDKSQLEDRIGALSSSRMHQIIAGARLLLEPRIL